MKALPLWEFVECLDYMYEQSRDEKNLDPEVEAAYQSRQYKKLQALKEGRE